MTYIPEKRSIQTRFIFMLACFLVLPPGALPAGADSPGAPSTRVVVSGRLLDVNGHTAVPRGLFGVHADTRLSVERAREWGIDAFRQIHFGPGSGSVA